MELKPGPVPKGLLVGPDLVVTRFPAPHRWATRGDHVRMPWADAAGLAGHPELWPGAGTAMAASYRLPAWTFARFRDDTRVVTRDQELSARETAARVLDVSGLVVDYIDEPAADGQTLLEWWGRHAFLAYTTGFNELALEERPPGPRWRVLLPFREPVDLEMARAVADWARHPRHDVGIVAPVTSEVWRAVPTPALGPGGYRWLAGRNDVLDAREAVRELHAWEALDVRVRAEQVLQGTSLAGAARRLLERRRRPRLRPRFPVPVPELGGVLGDLWPGRVVALLGAGGTGRTTLALQFAERAMRARLPVMLVLTRMGDDEAVARLVGLRTGHPAAATLAGEDGEDAIEALAEGHLPMHIWTPAAHERTLDRLTAVLEAASDAHGGTPILVVVDGVEGWAVDDPERGARALLSGLRDASHAGTLRADWPGVAVLFVAGAPDLPRSPDALEEAFLEGTLRMGPFEADAAAVVVVGVEGGEADLVVAKNRDGHTGSVRVGFEPGRGFGPLSSEE